MKLFFKKIWIFIKTYWYVAAILVLGFIALLVGGNRDISKIFDLIKMERDLGRREIELLEEVEKKKKEEKAKNKEMHKEAQKKLDKMHKEAQKKLEKKKEEKEEELSEEIKTSPSKTLERIAREMGWHHEE